MATDQTAAALQQLNAHLRNAGDASAAQIQGFYREVRRSIKSFDENRGLQLRPAIVTLSAAITTSTASQTNNDDFRVSTNEDFVVYEVRGLLHVNSWIAETLSIVGIGNPTTLDRAYMKASQCLINIKNKDTRVDITEHANIPLSSIMVEFGGSPLRFGGETRPAWIIPHNTTVQMTATLQSSDTTLIGASTNYGVMISGVYLSRPRED